MPPTDRYAPSPTSDLHLGNLRTALAGWLLTRAARGRWAMRVEDLDEARVRAAGGAERRNLADLRSLGLEWDGDVVRQSERIDQYRSVLADLSGRTFECFCSRRDLTQVSAPQGPGGYRPYPGTCARLSGAEAARLRPQRTPSLRIRSDGASFQVTDAHAGPVEGVVDDFVLVTQAGQFAYNFTVVVDDMAMGVDHITRGADLLPSAPRQAWLTHQLGGTPATYQSVGLVTSTHGRRLAKRDGSVTLADLAWDAPGVVALLSDSLGLGPCRSVTEALASLRRHRAATGAEPPSFWGGAVWDDAAQALHPIAQ